MNKKSMRERNQRAERQRKQELQVQVAKERHTAHLDILTKWAEENRIRCSLLIEAIREKSVGGRIQRSEVLRAILIDMWYQHEIEKGLKTCGKLRLPGELRRVLPGETRQKLIEILKQDCDPHSVKKELERELVRQREDIVQKVKAI